MLAFLCCLSLCLTMGFPAVAEELIPQPSYMTLRINKVMDIDLEVIAWPDGSFSLPVKALAKLLDAAPQQEATDHSISFTHPGTGEMVRVDETQKRITQGALVVDHLPHGVVYVEQGLFTEKELYIDQGLLAKFLDVSIMPNLATQQIQLDAQRPLKILLRISQTAQAELPLKRPPPALIPDAVPDKNLPLEIITLDFNSLGSHQLYRQNGLQAGQLPILVNTGATLTTGFQGHLGPLPYIVAPRLSYLNGSLGVSDVQAQLRWEGDKAQAVAGTSMPWLGNLVAPNTPILGMQYSSHNASGSSLGAPAQRTFNGSTPEATTVVLWLNDVPYANQSPKNNRYHFTQVPLTSNSVNKIKIMQKGLDGLETVLYQTEIPFYPYTLQKGETAYALFAGRSPLQWTPPGLLTPGSTNAKQGIFLSQSNKWLAGARYAYGLTDRLTLGASMAGDTVFGKPQTSVLNDLLYRIQSPDLTGYVGLRRDPNMVQGFGGGLTAAYRLNDRLTLTGDVALSHMNVLGNSLLSSAPSAGLAGILGADYHIGSTQINFKAYRYGTGYYTPITTGYNNLFDRQGVSLDVGGERYGWLYHTNLNHFQSNLSDVLDNGRITVNSWDASFFRRFSPTTDLQIRLYGIRGYNALQQLKMDNDQVTLTHLFRWNGEGRLGFRLASNQTYYDNVNGNGLVSLLSPGKAIHYVNASIRLPLGIHQVQLGLDYSEVLRYATMQGRFRLGRVSLEPFMQKSLPGPASLLSFGMGIYYQASNGQRIGLRYSYGVSSLPAISSGIASSQRTNHQVQLDFNDAFVLLGRQLTSIGRASNPTGRLKGVVFLDNNGNGKQEPNEPAIPHVAVMIDGNKTVQSNKSGAFILDNLAPGNHTLHFDLENMPISWTPTTPERMVEVGSRQQTRIAMGIMMTPGALSGMVHLVDGNQKPLSPADIMMVLKEVHTGKEIQYTYVDEKGQYSLDQVPPGDYLLGLSELQVKQKAYKLVTQPYPINVPMVPEGFYDKKNLDFNVIQLISGS